MHCIYYLYDTLKDDEFQQYVGFVKTAQLPMQNDTLSYVITMPTKYILREVGSKIYEKIMWPSFRGPLKIQYEKHYLNNGNDYVTENKQTLVVVTGKYFQKFIFSNKKKKSPLH